MLTPKMWALAGCLGAVSAAHAQPSAANNDGFQRRNGQMQVVRNGQARPMLRDAHLPTGATVTKDGFVVDPAGGRTELREGEGCDLRGRTVAVFATPGGRLALSAPVEVRPVGGQPAPSLLEALFGEGRDNDDEGYYKVKKAKKHHGKGKEKGHWKGDD